MEPGAILKHTEAIRAQLEQQFEGNPKAELDCWIATAQQREAMVVQVYNALRLERRIPDQSQAEAETVHNVREIIGSIWAQESSHVALIGALRKVDDPAKWQVTGPQGTVEGLMTSWVTSGGLLGTLAGAGIWAARVVRAAPEFTAALAEQKLSEFFSFSAELEQTASNGYVRILELIGELEAAGTPPGFGALARYEFATVLAEERFHQATFERMQGWLTPDGQGLDAIEESSIARAIEALVAEHLPVRKVSGLPRKSAEAQRFLEAEGDALISDAGMGRLLRRLAVPFRLAKRPKE